MHYWCFLIILTASVNACTALSKHPVIIVTAFDGFRYDYLSRGLTPILDEIAANGTKAKYMMNQFPTITFPNFHSISTGMHPETHGVLGNKAFNEKKECLDFSYELFHYNEDIVPLWNLNELSGDQRYSGVMMWPGTNFEYQKRRTTFHYDFNDTVSWQFRVDTVLSWIVNETTPANLVYLYFEQPDGAGHHFGPDSNELNDQLKRINEIVVYFFQQLTERGIREKVNLIFLADHGMAGINSEEIIDLEQYLNSNAYTFCGTSPGLQILPKAGLEDEVHKNLTAASAKLKTFTVYKHHEIPDRWYYKNNKRSIGFFLESNVGYVFQDAKTLKGDHGYDNKEMKMHPIFIALGPLIKENYEIQPFSNIDLFPLISHILHLKSLPAHLTPNGTLSSVISLLKEDYKRYEYLVN